MERVKEISREKAIEMITKIENSINSCNCSDDIREHVYTVENETNSIKDEYISLSELIKNSENHIGEIESWRGAYSSSIEILDSLQYEIDEELITVKNMINDMKMASYDEDKNTIKEARNLLNYRRENLLLNDIIKYENLDNVILSWEEWNYEINQTVMNINEFKHRIKMEIEKIDQLKEDMVLQKSNNEINKCTLNLFLEQSKEVDYYLISDEETDGNKEAADYNDIKNNETEKSEDTEKKIDDKKEVYLLAIKYNVLVEKSKGIYEKLEHNYEEYSHYESLLTDFRDWLSATYDNLEAVSIESVEDMIQQLKIFISKNKKLQFYKNDVEMRMNNIDAEIYSKEIACENKKIEEENSILKQKNQYFDLLKYKPEAQSEIAALKVKINEQLLNSYSIDVSDAMVL